MMKQLFEKLNRWPGRWFGLATLIWLGLMFWFSSQPATESSHLSGRVLLWLADLTTGLIHRSWFMAALAQTIIRKSAHFLNYTMLGILATLANNQRFSWRLLLFGLLAAAFDESHQLLVPGRSGEVRDVLIDLGGYLTGSGVIGLIARAARAHSVKARSTAS